MFQLLLILFAVLSDFQHLSAFNLTCPLNGHWILRSLMCKPQEKYKCLLDANNNTYVERCDGPVVFARRGYKNVVRQNVDISTCSEDRYQPFKFSTKEQSNCKILKSFCNEEGQILHSNGTTISDRTCRCDYTKGFAFITQPKNTCFCLPTKEDCTCYLKQCIGSLSPDYRCVEEDLPQNNTSCVSVNTTVINRSEDHNVQIAEIAEKGIKIYRWNADSCVLPLGLFLCMIIFSSLGTGIYKFYWKDVFKTCLVDQNCCYGDEIVFMFNATRAGLKAKWLKNGMQIRSNIPRYFINEQGTTHKLTIEPADFSDAGTFSVIINSTRSSAQLTVSDVFKTPLRDQKCYFGENVVFSCEVAKENLTSEWYKNGMNIKDKNRYSINVEGTTHKLMIQAANFADAGSLNVKVRSLRSDAQLTVSDVFNIHLVDQTCGCGDTISLSCEVVRQSLTLKWFKDGIEITKENTRYMISVEGKTHKLTIHSAKDSDSGTFSADINGRLSNAHLTVQDDLTVAPEEINYLHIVHLIAEIAVPAVRRKFDEEFSPKVLKDTIQKSSGTIRYLTYNKSISFSQMIQLNKIKLSSKNFDVRLMVCLLRNIAGYNIKDNPPFLPTNTSAEADLSRIKYYRNMIAHSHGKLSDEDFPIYWNELSQASKRLAPNIYEQYFNGKMPDEYDKEETDIVSRALTVFPKENIETNGKTIRTYTANQKRYLRIVHLLHRIACPAVREKFDIIFPPEKLKDTLDRAADDLKELHKDQQISKFELNILYPKNGKPSSKMFGLKLMSTLLFNLKKEEKEELHKSETEALTSLEEKLHLVAEYKLQISNKDDFNQHWVEISSSVVTLGGKRYKRICTLLNPDQECDLDFFCP